MHIVNSLTSVSLLNKGTVEFHDDMDHSLLEDFLIEGSVELFFWGGPLRGGHDVVAIFLIEVLLGELGIVFVEKIPDL
jgi:hypothetical protein